MNDEDETQLNISITPENNALDIEDSYGNQLVATDNGLTIFCEETGEIHRNNNPIFKPADIAESPMEPAFVKAGLSANDLEPTALDQATAVMRAIGITNSEPRKIERKADLGQMPSPLQKACDALNETEIASKPSGRDGRG